MPNKNKQSNASVCLMNLKLPCGNNYNQALKLDFCECAICLMKSFSLTQKFKPIEKDENYLINFIKEFPSIFPLGLVSTTAYDSQRGNHLHYSNGSKQQNKSLIVKMKTQKLFSNFPTAHNIHVFGDNFSKIIAKHEISSFIKNFQEKKQNQQRKTQSQKKMTSSAFLPALTENYPSQVNPESNGKMEHKNSKILYIQAYNHQIPTKVYYDRLTIKLKFDSIILEYLDEQEQNFSLQKAYHINEEFWQWIFTQYGQMVFVNFITEFYCRAYQFFSKNIIHKAIFYWIFEKPKSQFGDNTKVTQDIGKHKEMLEAQYLMQKSKRLNFKIKLANVKNPEIQIYKNILSFQQEYQDMILSKIKSFSNPQKKESLNQKKNYIYQGRLDTLHSKVRELFLKEQNKVLNKVQVEKQFEGHEDSNRLARLLLPGMREDQTIRDILNDEFAFQKLILFQQKRVTKQRLKRARQRLLTQTQIFQKLNSRNISQQSLSKKRNFASRRIRNKTEY